MSKRNKELFLFDILIAILKIKHYANDYNDAQSLKYDLKTWDAVIREFEIIGEATNHLIKLKHFSNNKREIVDFRNILIHEYFGIDADEIWGIIKNFLDEYQADIEKDILKMDQKNKSSLINQLIEENRHIDFICQKLESFKELL